MKIIDKLSNEEWLALKSEVPGLEVPDDEAPFGECITMQETEKSEYQLIYFRPPLDEREV